LFVVLLVMAPSSQELEPPANPGRFTTPHVEVLLRGASYIDEYCESLGYPLFGRMPIRRRPKTFEP
jgi:hypothetical protein